MMIRAADSGCIKAMLYSAVDLCFLGEKSRLRSYLNNRLHYKKNRSKNNNDRSNVRNSDISIGVGVEYLRMAAKRNNAEANFLLGHLAAAGDAGQEEDRLAAEAFFQKAAQLGLQ